MKDAQQQFLQLIPNLPARIIGDQVAWILNFQSHDIAVLAAEGLLKPLGNPPPNAVKYFWAADILELGKDKVWLARATNTIHRFWQRKNQRKKRPQSTGGAIPQA